jgi:hypothetical protein
LKIVERVESGRSKANQEVYFVSVEFQNCSSWVKEEKLYSVADALKDEAGLQMKKTRLAENNDFVLPVTRCESYGTDD